MSHYCVREKHNRTTFYFPLCTSPLFLRAQRLHITVPKLLFPVWCQGRRTSWRRKSIRKIPNLQIHKYKELTDNESEYVITLRQEVNTLFSCYGHIKDWTTCPKKEDVTLLHFNESIILQEKYSYLFDRQDKINKWKKGPSTAQTECIDV